MDKTQGFSMEGRKIDDDGLGNILVAVVHYEKLEQLIIFNEFGAILKAFCYLCGFITILWASLHWNPIWVLIINWESKFCFLLCANSFNSMMVDGMLSKKTFPSLGP